MASAVTGGLIGLAVGAVAGAIVAGLRNEPIFGAAMGIGAAAGVVGGAVVATKVVGSGSSQIASNANTTTSNSATSSTSSSTGLPPEPGSGDTTVD
jgi:hypothetical protein